MGSSLVVIRSLLILLLGAWACRADVVPTPGGACVLAHQDITQPGVGSPYIRYFFTTDRSPEFYGAFNWVMNACVSHSSTTFKADRTGNGWLIRCDFSKLTPQKNDLENLLREYEKLVTIEPYFHTLGELQVVEKEDVLVDAAPYVQDGKTYTKKWIKRDKVIRTERGAEHALHLGNPEIINRLTFITQSQLPVVRADWFMFLVLTQDPAENGKYYTFRQIEKSSGDKTAEQLWLESQGVDYKTIKQIRSDQRIAKWTSNITGNPRAVEYFYSSATRPSVGPAPITITRDWFVGKVAPNRHPLKNLLGYDYDGTEGIGWTKAGFPTFTLFDGKEQLVNVAPSNLATDRTVPNPHPTNLQPPMSCIRCHGPTEMWMDAFNDVEVITRGKFGVNIFDDVADGVTPEDALDRLTGLYAGELDEPLRQARNTLARSTFIATDGMSIKDVSAKISSIYQKYRYDPITPATACLELGYSVPEGKEAVTTYNDILPQLPANRHGIRPESPLVGSLRAWTKEKPIKINRNDWEHEYSDIMLRVTISKLLQSKVEKAK